MIYELSFPQSLGILSSNVIASFMGDNFHASYWFLANVRYASLVKPYKALSPRNSNMSLFRF